MPLPALEAVLTSSSSTPGPARPAERYGAPPPWVRWSTILVVVALALSTAAWLLWAALYEAGRQVSSRLVSFRIVDDHRVDVTIQVDRTTSVAATCRVTAQAGDRALVGDLTFVVRAQEASSVIVTQSVPTERLATNAVLYGCTTADQPQPR